MYFRIFTLAALAALCAVFVAATSDIELATTTDLIARGLDSHKRMTKRAAKQLSVTITYYTKHDLLNPACQNKSRWNPTDKSAVIAVTEVWSGKPACGTWWQLSYKGKTVTARVVDYCAGCKHQDPHFDLTLGAFKHLLTIDAGEAHGVKAKQIKAPKSWDVSIYGPKEL